MYAVALLPEESSYMIVEFKRISDAEKLNAFKGLLKGVFVI
jgi:hypothetical protein